ncbi:MAG: hypothetical protein SWY16_27215 [Cyanobacteriota bacterium]|nr:hypothetical protein [Cyanobacteriota bacterium]
MMAKLKSEEIGTLPPAMFDLEALSTPVSSQSEAGIDTKGHDPAWDDPEFCQTKPDVREACPQDNRPFPTSELRIPNSEADPCWQSDEFGELEFVPENDGQLTISAREIEPPDPDDYSTTEAYERAWADWSANREAAPKPVTPEVVESESTLAGDELSYEEKCDRLHLERKVERAFYEAGRALRELRDRRLYRSTHKTFENYCRDRFGHSRQKSNYLIAAVGVFENLTTNSAQTEGAQKMTTNGCQNDSTESVTTNGRQNPSDDEMTTNGCQNSPDREMTTNSAQTEMGTNGCQILPTSERQIRSLAKLEPDRQREVWQQAVTEAGGKVPSGRIVKDIVERMQHVESPPESPTRAHHLTLEPWGLVEVSCSGNPKIHARLGRIATVKEKTVEVWVRDTDTMMMVKHTLKHHQVEAVPMERAPGLRELCDRFSALRERGLDPFELEVLALLERSVVLTPREMEGLAWIEGRD